MKRIRQYCNVVNRMKHNPACREEVLSMAARKKIRISGRGAAAGTAVAAVLLALNIGGGYLLLSGSTTTGNSMVATNELDVQTEVTQPLYVTKMQEYYTAVSGTPCDFDFTGYGRDLGFTYEDVDGQYRVTLTAITGCDWMFYYFYDVEPLQGQSWEEFNADGLIHLIVRNSDGEHLCATSFGREMPNQGEELDDGVWHCYGYMHNVTRTPFRTESCSLRICTNGPDYGVEEDHWDTQVMDEIPLDFLTIPSTLGEAAETWYFDYDKVRLIGDNGVDLFKPLIETQHGISVVEMTQCEITPFGAFYFTEPYRLANGGSGMFQSSYMEENPAIDIHIQSAFVQQNELGETIDTFLPANFTCTGTYCSMGEATSYIYVLFDHPWDAAKGALVQTPLDGIDESAEDDEATQADSIKTVTINDEATGELVYPSEDVVASLNDAEKAALADVMDYWATDIFTSDDFIYHDETDRLELNYHMTVPQDREPLSGCELFVTVTCEGRTIALYSGGKDSENQSDYLETTLYQLGSLSEPLLFDRSEIAGANQFEVNVALRPMVTVDGEENTAYFLWTKPYRMTDGVY